MPSPPCCGAQCLVLFCTQCHELVAVRQYAREQASQNAFIAKILVTNSGGPSTISLSKADGSIAKTSTEVSQCALLQASGSGPGLSRRLVELKSPHAHVRSSDWADYSQLLR
jgi:hypothetical protein